MSGRVTETPVCRICSAVSTDLVLDLGDQPLANALLEAPEDEEKTYPLAIFRCQDCGLIQLGYIPEPSEVFSHYVWVTGTAAGTVAYLKELTGRLAPIVGGWFGRKVIEVASNDGTLLGLLQEQGASVLGVDPAVNLAALASEAGVETRADFFDEDLAAAIVAERGDFDVAIARNVLPHVPDPATVIAGMARAVGPTGQLVVEFHWASKIMEELQYDSIYHEHACFLRLADVERLLAPVGFKVDEILPSPISGGSLLAIASRNGVESSSVRAVRDAEVDSGVGTLSAWRKFALQAKSHRDLTAACLAEQGGEVVVAWGASARSSTFLNYLATVSAKEIAAVIDLNPYKQGKFTPGTRIPIVDVEAGLELAPESCLILAWNFSPEIRDDLAKRNFTGRTIEAFPPPVRVTQL